MGQTEKQLTDTKEPVAMIYQQRPFYPASPANSAVDTFFTWLVILIVAVMAAGLAYFLWRESRYRINRQVVGLLKARYARGELSREEFDEMRREIERV